MLITPAYAKLNLALAVIARREDGWHDIDSVLTPIDWHDLIGVEIRAADAVAVSLRLSGPAAAGVPAGEDNLTVRAGQALSTAARLPLDIRIWLDKRVPHGAGLGGGSADAAAVLATGSLLLARSGHRVEPAALHEAALAVGSDVPALLGGSACRVGGRGELLTAINAEPRDIVVVSTVPSSTAATYAAVLPQDMGDDGRVARLVEVLEEDGATADALLGSALEPAAVRASTAVGEAVGRVRGAVPETTWHLTGSGGALFALAESEQRARELERRVRDAGFAARACRTLASRADRPGRHYNPAS
jgi:4-diphosphocytidyl-2-C-methyl-D-erythritol kinase